MDTKDEIRSRLPIEQLVAQYCQLKRKGRNFVSLCPFHNDTHPSFLVSPDKGIAYCFACQSGGDIFSFYQKIESVDFPEAVRALAEKAGVEIPKERMKGKPGPSKDEKERLQECLDTALAFYQKKLKEVPLALEYVRKRGVPDELIQKFQIGYAPDSFSETYDHLLRSGFSRSEIVAAGLGVQKELQDSRIYDRFRNRVMFPISAAQGNLIGFGGRTMGDSDAKYVNSPESVLYHKSSVLFGLHEAREAIRVGRKIVVVEGYFDLIAAHKAGVQNVVAVSGTALTDEHVRMIKRYADEVTLCLDQDSAGELAAGRAFDLLCRAHLIILSATLPAKDPDELVQRDPTLFKHLIEAPTPYIDAVIEKLKHLPDAREPSGKRKIAEKLFPLLAAVPTSTELRSYLQKAAQMFGFVESEMNADYRSWTTSPSEKKSPKDSELKNHPYTRRELAIGLAFLYPSTRTFLQELLLETDDPLVPVKDALIHMQGEENHDEVLSALAVDPLLKEKLSVLVLYAEEAFPEWSENMAVKEFRKLVQSANREALTLKQVAIVEALKDARRRGRPDDEAKLLTQYQKLLKLTQMTLV